MFTFERIAFFKQQVKRRWTAANRPALMYCAIHIRHPSKTLNYWFQMIVKILNLTTIREEKSSNTPPTPKKALNLFFARPLKLHCRTELMTPNQNVF